MPLDVLVVGSLNEDLTITVDHHPIPGETVLGTDHVRGPGGKGANQAVAIARLGGDVAMIGRVGADASGDYLTGILRAAGVDISGISRDPEAATGLAIITVDPEAENSIVVSPGANMRLEPVGSPPAAKVVLTQLEIPLATAVALAAGTNAIFCLNPAPAQPLPDGLLNRVDVLIPNRSELGILAGVSEPRSLEDVVQAAHHLDGPGAIVVTLGAKGAVVIEAGVPTSIRAPKVDPLDTTGAGDAFCGALAYSLSKGSSLIDATEKAVIAGAIATTKKGAQSALPTSFEVETFLTG